LLVSNIKSLRVKNNNNKNKTGYICHGKWGDESCIKSIFDVTLPGTLGIVVHQDYYRDHYREENSCPRNNAMKIQTPKSR
jgi:hypothetical protein